MSTLSTLISQILSAPPFTLSHASSSSFLLLPSHCPPLQSLLTGLPKGGDVTGGCGSLIAAMVSLEGSEEGAQHDVIKKLLLFYPLILHLLTSNLDPSLLSPLLLQFTSILSTVDPKVNTLGNALISSPLYALTNNMILNGVEIHENFKSELGRYNNNLSEILPGTFFPSLSIESNLKVYGKESFEGKVFKEVKPKSHPFLHNISSSKSKKFKKQENSQDGGVLEEISESGGDFYCENLYVLSLKMYKYNLSTSLINSGKFEEALKEVDMCLSLPGGEETQVGEDEGRVWEILGAGKGEEVEETRIVDGAFKRLILLNMLCVPHSTLKTSNLHKRRYDLGQHKRHFDFTQKDASNLSGVESVGFEIPDGGGKDMDLDRKKKKTTYKTVWKNFKEGGDVRVVEELKDVKDEHVELRQKVVESYSRLELEKLKVIYKTIPVKDLPDCGYDVKVVNGFAVFEEERKEIDLKELEGKVEECKRVIREREKGIESGVEYQRKVTQQK